MILERPTMPMLTFAVDFETEFDKSYSVKTLGPVAYVNDTRFNCYLVSICGDDGFEWVGHPKDAPWWQINGGTWVSHNRGFDAAVFLRLLKMGIVPDQVGPSEWFCTADLCAYLQFPRALADACQELFGVKLKKDVRAKQRGKKYPDELWPDSELAEYAMDDARYCLKLWIEYGHLWPDHERWLSHLTTFWGYGGIYVDRNRVEQDIAALKTLRWNAEQALPWTGDGETVVLSVKHLAAACRDAGIEPPPSLAMTDEDCEAWLEKYGDQYPWVGAMRDWRRTNMLLTKYEAIRNRTDARNRMSYNLKYCGAQHTGRWSGDAGVNMQNLPRGDLFGCNLRNVFIPAPGHKFVVADFSQIEPRVLAWLAEDHKLLDEIAKHHDFYEAQARAMGLWSGDAELRSDPKTRHLVKGLNLGLGYGMSWQRFAQITGMDPTEAQRLTALYRAKNKPVLDMWGELERKARIAAGRKDNRTLSLELPSGRTIRYFDMKNNPKLTGAVVRGGRRVFLWGGFLTENMTQAVAREVMAAALLRVDQIPDCRIVWHVHDEIICEVPDALAGAKQREIESAMTAPPEWASDLPIAVESSIEERYTK
jgi:hypothetical protein